MKSTSQFSFRQNKYKRKLCVKPGGIYTGNSAWMKALFHVVKANYISDILIDTNQATNRCSCIYNIKQSELKNYARRSLLRGSFLLLGFCSNTYRYVMENFTATTTIVCFDFISFVVLEAEDKTGLVLDWMGFSDGF